MFARHRFLNGSCAGSRLVLVWGTRRLIRTSRPGKPALKFSRAHGPRGSRSETTRGPAGGQDPPPPAAQRATPSNRVSETFVQGQSLIMIPRSTLGEWWVGLIEGPSGPLTSALGAPTLRQTSRRLVLGDPNGTRRPDRLRRSFLADSGQIVPARAKKTVVAPPFVL